MNFHAALTLIIAIAALGALASQRLRADLVALLVSLSLILSGVLSAQEAFSAFGQPIIIVIPSIYILGSALYETGVATFIANQVLRAGSRGPLALLLVLMLTAGALSSVLTSLLVVAVLMPAVLRMARQQRLAPSLLLLPLVAGATMGNLLSLIGTISNLVVSEVLSGGGYAGLGLLTLTPYGLVFLALTVGWFLVAGRRLLPSQVTAKPQPPSLGEVEHAYQLEKQLYRLRVRSSCDLIGRRLEDSRLRPAFGLNVIAIQPRNGVLQPARPDWTLEQDDNLMVEGSLGEVLQAASLHVLEMKGQVSLEEFNRLEADRIRLAELIVPFRSQLVGKSLAGVRFRERYGLNVLAVHRQGQTMRQDLPQLALASGDTLLVQGPRSDVRHAGHSLNLVSVTELGPQPGDVITRKARVAVAIMAAMLIAVVPGWLSLATASLAAAVALILSGCLSVERAYHSIDASIIVLIGGMLPLATALEKTGLAGLIASTLTHWSQGLGPLGSLFLLYLLTSLITQVVSNSVTAALVTPIGVSLAVAQNLSPLPFAIAVAVGVTTSYVMPLTNTDVLLVRQPGHYNTRDYLMQGLPLFVMQTVALLLMLSISVL
jgi:di/tricarboxylate transporter